MEAIALAEIRTTPLSVDEVLAAVKDDRAGGTAFFVGTVRNHDHGRDVAALSYSAHPTAEQRMRDVMEKIVADTADGTVHRVAAVHRVGDLTVGDLAVVVAAAAPTGRKRSRSADGSSTTSKQKCRSGSTKHSPRATASGWALTNP